MIELRVDNHQLIEALDRLSSKLSDLSPVMHDLSLDMLDAVRENFDEEGRPDKWQALAPSTLRALARKGKTGKMLNRSAGGLYISITPNSDANTAMVGTNKRYAAIHHFGGMAGRGRKVAIPARPFMVLDEPDKRRMMETLHRYLAGS